MDHGPLKALQKYSASSASESEEEQARAAANVTISEEANELAQPAPEPEESLKHKIREGAHPDSHVGDSLDKDAETVSVVEDAEALYQTSVDGLPPMTRRIKFRVLTEGGGVSCLEVTPNGRRLFVGSEKGLMLMYNIAQMDTVNSPSEQWADYEGRAVKLIKFDASGKQLAVCFGEPYLSVKDNANTILWETYHGDMYVRDSAKTFGHVHQINDVLWADEFTIISCGDDTTARVFDCRTPPKGLDQRITSSLVFKTTDDLNRSITNKTLVNSIIRIPPSKLYPKPLNDKPLLAGACSDGSVQIWEASWPAGLKSRKPLKVIRGFTNSAIYKVAFSGTALFMRTNDEIISFDLCTMSLRGRVRVVSNLPNAPALAVYQATESKCSYILTVDEKNALRWYSDHLRFMKALDPPSDDSLTCLLVTKADNQIIVGGRSGYCYGYWAESDHLNRANEAPKGLALVKETADEPVTSGLASDIHTSYSIYELPQNYKLYNDDIVKEVKPRRGRLRESKLPRRQ